MKIVLPALVLLFTAVLHGSPAFPASLEKAVRYLEEGSLDAARRHLEAVIRKGDPAAREGAHVHLAKSYFLEKDFQGVIRSLKPIQDRIPDNSRGAWMRLYLYSAARVAGDSELATRQYQALVRIRPDLSIADIAEFLKSMKKSGALQKRLLPFPPPAAARRANFHMAESLMGFDITRGAARLWTALLVGPPDEWSRLALLRLCQALDADGDWREAGRYSKLFVLLYPDDPRAADVLYRLKKWSVYLGGAADADPQRMAADYYPSTLYGAAALVDRAASWNDRARILSALLSVRESPGLPESLVEQALRLAIASSEDLPRADIEWAARRYLAAFPMGSAGPRARSILSAGDR